MEVADVLEAISDNKSLELFRIVALAKQDASTLMSNTKLTRNQLYSRISNLMNAGLIKRKNGKLILSAFGKVIYFIILIRIEYAISCYSSLKAIDLFEMSNYLQIEELEKAIDKLIDNQEIKTVLISNINSPYVAVIDRNQNPKGNKKPKTTTPRKAKTKR